MSRHLAVLATVVAATLAGAGPAAAHHIAGATYRGTHAQGGTVDFDLSPDGTSITRFRVTNVRGDTCTVGEVENLFPGGSGPPITRHGFEQRSGGGRNLDFHGSFLDKQQVEGGFFYDSTSNPFQPPCLSEIVRYTARTSASPARTEECIRAKRAVRKARKAVRKAKKAVRRARTAGARRKAKRKLRKARKRLKKARREQKEAC